jgi:ABC-type nitrate/sulfonate/bicarbonate transport system permease component
MQWNFKAAAGGLMKRFNVLFPLIGVAMLWEFLSQSGIVSRALFPPPSAVIAAGWGLVRDGSLLSDSFSSLWRAYVGLVVGVVGGIGVGLFTGRSEKGKFITPIIHMLRPLPPVAIIPLIIVWLGIDNTAKLFSISFAVFFPVWINTHNGTAFIAKELIWGAGLYPGPRLRIFTKVIFPATLPHIMTGVRSLHNGFCIGVNGCFEGLGLQNCRGTACI